MTDNLEIQDLKDCLLLEQEEKNELNKRVQDLEKECMFFYPCLFGDCLVYQTKTIGISV